MIKIQSNYLTIHNQDYTWVKPKSKLKLTQKQYFEKLSVPKYIKPIKTQRSFY